MASLPKHAASVRLSAAALQRFVPVLILIALIAAITAYNPNFLSVRNFGRIGVSAAPSLLVAVGATFIILMGSIDLSMEGTVALCAVVFATLLHHLGGVAGWGLLAVPAVVLTGILMGLINGLIHVKLQIPSFMASLSMGFVGLGATFIISGGYRINVADPVFRALLTERIFELPLMVYAALIGLAVGWFVETYTVLGRNFYAIGGGEDLARASGLNVGRIRVAGFALAGLFFSLGALLAVARVGIADGDSGSNQMFAAITAVVVGGTSLMGGNGGVLNTLVGVLIVAVINNGMIVLGLPNYVQSGVLGTVVILAVVLSTDRRAIAFAK